MSKLSFAVLGVRDFRLLVLTRLCIVMALQAQAVIVGWQIYTLTKDPFMLGLVGLTEAGPAILAALFAGYLVDVSRPHRIFLLCLVALVLNVSFLALIGGGWWQVGPSALVGLLFVGVFFSGLARSFTMPASFALLGQVVNRSQMPAASAWLSSGFQVAAVSGPALAGLVYGGYGASVAWFMPLVLMSCALILVAGMSRFVRSFKPEMVRAPAFESIKAGWSFILHNRTLLSVMALDMFAVLFGGAVAMLPAYADQVLQVGSEGLGLLRAAPAAGALLTALYFAVRPFKIIRARTLLFVVAGFGLSMIGFGFSSVFWLSLLFLALSGAFDSVSMVIRGTLMQWLTPEDMRGRVSAVNSMFIISSNEIGAFQSGLAARLLGLVPSVVFGGCMTLFVVGLTSWFSPAFRRLEVKADT